LRRRDDPLGILDIADFVIAQRPLNVSSGSTAAVLHLRKSGGFTPASRRSLVESIVYSAAMRGHFWGCG
jgi:hypothetical protein